MSTPTSTLPNRRQPRPRQARHRRSPRAVASGPSGGGPLGRGPLGEELGVELQRVLVLLGDLELGEDRVDRAGLDAGVAIDAELRVDEELLRRLEIRVPGLRMDAVDRTDLDARVVLDAAAGDDVGHVLNRLHTPEIRVDFKGGGPPPTPRGRRTGSARAIREAQE